MAKTGKVPESSGVKAQDRVKQLLKLLWGNNQAAMAQDAGCSRAAIYKITSGRQPPGRRVLAAIASHPKVNPSWLFDGTGEPLLVERQEGFTGGYVLPVYKRLPPGAPLDQQNLQSGQWFPVPQAFHRPTRYWFEISNDPIVDALNEKVAVGDLLLMETDADSLRTPEELIGRFGAVVIPAAENKGKQMRLAALTCDPDSPKSRPSLLANVFDSAALYTISISERHTLTVGVPKSPPKRRKLLRPREIQERVINSEATKQVPISPVGMQLADLVAVCVLLFRRCYPGR